MGQGAIAAAGNYAWRDYVSDGIPSSGPNDPQKKQIRAVLAQIDVALASQIEGLILGNAVVYSTIAALQADLAHPDQTLAVVYNDPELDFNGIYAKMGAVGLGIWAATELSLPSNFADDLTNILAQIADITAAEAAAAASAAAAAASQLTAANDVTAAATSANASATSASLAATAAGQASAAIEAAVNAAGIIRIFDTFAAANAGLAAIPDQGVVEVLVDETQNGARTVYRKVSGAYVLKLTYAQPFLLRLPSTASMATTIVLPNVNIIETYGCTTQGDYGGMIFTRSTISGTGPGRRQTGDGAWWDSASQNLHSRQFGAMHNCPTSGDCSAANDDTAALNEMIACAKTRGLNACRLDWGCALITGMVKLPTFTTVGVAWNTDNPMNLDGYGIGTSILRYVGTDSHAIAHPTIGTTGNRGQNFGVDIHHFTLIGPQDFTNPAKGIGVDNTTSPLPHSVHIYGFTGNATATDAVGGAALHVYGHGVGGSYGLRVRDVRFGQSGPYHVVNGNTCFLLTEMEQFCNRVCVYLDGPDDTGGKVNDVVCEDSRFENFLICAVLCLGHGSYDTTKSQGANANIRSSHCVFYSEAAREMETGTLSGVASTSQVTLRASNALYTNTGDLVGLSLILVGPDGRPQAHYITAFDGPTRTCTLDGAYTFTPVAGVTQYYVNYADLYARLKFNGLALQHVWYWPSQSPYTGSSTGDYYERCVPIVAEAYATHKFTFTDPDVVVNIGLLGLMPDGTKWKPKLAFQHTPPSSGRTPSHLQTPSLNLEDPEFPNVDAPLTHVLNNATGLSLSMGSVVRQSTSQQSAVTSSDYNTDSSKHFIVGNVVRVSFDNGEDITCVRIGKVTPCLVTGTGVPGDFVLPTLGQMGIVVSFATIKASPWIGLLAIGRLLSPKTSTNMALVNVSAIG